MNKPYPEKSKTESIPWRGSPHLVARMAGNIAAGISDRVFHTEVGMSDAHVQRVANLSVEIANKIISIVEAADKVPCTSSGVSDRTTLSDSDSIAEQNKKAMNSLLTADPEE